MRVELQNVSVWSLFGVWLLGCAFGGGLGAGVIFHNMNERLTAYELNVKLLREQKTITEKLLSTASCPDSVFQEKTIMLPDGGTYQCGAVRTIPINQKELDKWYKSEAQKLLRAKQ